MEASTIEESRWAGLKEVSALAFPIMLGTMSHTVMQFVDYSMVSRLGDEYVAAFGAAGVWSFNLSAFFIGVAACVSTFVSQSRGRGRPEDCGSYAWQGIYFSMGAGVFALFLWPFTGPAFRMAGHAPDVTALEITYFQVRLLGYAFIAWQAALAAFFQSINRPMAPTVVSIIAILLNVLLDYVLIFGKWGFPAWGIGGAALATVLSLGFQAAVLQVLFMDRGVDEAYGTRRGWRLHRAKLLELLRIGGPSGLYMTMDVLVWSVFITLIVGSLGTVTLSANNVAVMYMHVGFMPAVGIHYAITPIVGQWIGRGNIARAKARTYTGVKMAMAYMLTVGLLLATFGEFFMSLYSNNPEVIDLGRTMLIFTALFMGFDAINIVVSGALRGAGDTRFMAIVTFVSAYVFFLPIAASLALVFGLGAVGAWTGATLYIIGLSGLLYWRFRSERWRDIKIFADEQVQQDIPVPLPEGYARPEAIPVAIETDRG